jgi:hypothetical protein
MSKCHCGGTESPQDLSEEFSMDVFGGGSALVAAELREIWRLAGAAGLIKGEDDCRKYRAWLFGRFRRHTTAELTGPERAAAMNELRRMMAAYA